MRTKGTKYEVIDQLPDNAQPVSAYAADNGIRNPSYVCVKYDRYLAGNGSKPTYTIRCWQGMNMVIPN